MSGRQARLCRRLAYQEATRQDLWSKGRKSMLNSWWSRFLDRYFKRRRQRNDNLVARWYRRTVKAWAKLAYQRLHDRDYLELLRVQRKLRKEFHQRRLEK